MDGAKGNCAAGTETCLNTGKWSTCSIVPAPVDSCAVTGDDANCNGVKNDGCPCVTGNTQSCGPAAVGICKPGVSTCTNGVWGACVGAINASARDCTSSADNDCDNRPDNTIDTICQCGSGTTQACNAHPGYDGKGPCKAGSQSCVVASDRKSSAWNACSGAVGPAAGDTCAQGNDDNCTGTPNEGCICINNVTVKTCGLCGDGSATCTDGKNGAYGPCNGAVGQAFTPLALTGGWTNYSTSTSAPAIGIDCGGMVVFKGALSSIGTDPAAFTIPVGYRPPLTAYLGLDVVGGRKGRLYAPPTGGAQISGELAFSNATSFTSLDGVSYALNATGYTPLTLINGWTNYSTGTRAPAISNAGGIVRLQGAISSSGSSLVPFTLPVGYRPPTDVYIPTDLVGASKGRLHITAAGNVAIEPYGATTTATAFTSLEGLSFPLNATGYTTMSLVNGWAHAPFYTRNVAATVSNGIVRLQGAMAAPDGSSTTAFTLPAGFRPPATVYLRTSMCSSSEGRVNISAGGVVSVQAENVATDATCFTSLEGVWFGL